MNRRVLTSLLAACALLAQSLAVAGMGPMLKPVQSQDAAEQSMPCHGDGESSASAAGDCCDTPASCAAACAPGCPALSSIVDAAVPAELPTDSAVSPAATAAHTLTPLRPPITSQS